MVFRKHTKIPRARPVGASISPRPRARIKLTAPEHHPKTSNPLTFLVLVLYVPALAMPFVFAGIPDNPLDLAIDLTNFVGGVALIGFMIYLLEATYADDQRRRRNVETDFLNMTPAAFEHYIADLFRARGYQATVTGRTSDGGIDVRIRKGMSVSIVQCKRYGGGVGVKALREFTAVADRARVKRAYFVTTSHFTREAIEWAKGDPTLVLVDHIGLTDWIKEAGFGPFAEERLRPRTIFSMPQWAVITFVGVWGLAAITSMLAFLLPY